MKTLRLLASGTNASAGLIIAGSGHWRLFPRANPGDGDTVSQAWWGIRLEFFRVCFVSCFLFCFLLFFYRPASTGPAATGSKAAQRSATSSVVTDNEPKHTALIPGCRQEKQLTTCHPTWELLLHNLPKTRGKYCHQHVLIAPRRAATLNSIIQSTAC